MRDCLPITILTVLSVLSTGHLSTTAAVAQPRESRAPMPELARALLSMPGINARTVPHRCDNKSGQSVDLLGKRSFEEIRRQVRADDAPHSREGQYGEALVVNHHTHGALYYRRDGTLLSLRMDAAADASALGWTVGATPKPGACQQE
jgi:hypothetical protein